MFRRNHNDRFDNSQTLYDEKPSFNNNYPYQRNDNPSQLFDPPSKDIASSNNVRPMQESHQPKQDNTNNQWELKDDINLENDMIIFSEDTPETTLGEGVVFKGELAFERLLRIDGSFEGSLISSGKIIVGPKGIVKADINLNDAIIEGRVEGNISVKGTLELRGEACVIGDITANALCVDEGASITGYLCISGGKESNKN